MESLSLRLEEINTIKYRQMFCKVVGDGYMKHNSAVKSAALKIPPLKSWKWGNSTRITKNLYSSWDLCPFPKYAIPTIHDTFAGIRRVVLLRDKRCGLMVLLPEGIPNTVLLFAIKINTKYHAYQECSICNLLH